MSDIEFSRRPPADGGVESLTARFFTQAKADPGALALIAGARFLRRGELAREAGRLAGRLRSAGVGRQSRVGVLIDQSPEAVVALLSTLLIGAVYVPIDPGLAEARRNLLIEQSSLSAILVARRPQAPLQIPTVFVDLLDTSPIGVMPTPVECHALEAAYLIYTSGSSGSPKGVVVSCGGLANLMGLFGEKLGVGTTDRVAQFATLSFDASIWEISMALTTGATLVILDKANRTSQEVAAQIREQGVTVATLPPTFLRTVEPDEMPNLRLLILAGETTPPPLAKRWQASHRTLVNAYGPTESTVCATFAILREGDEESPIGLPIPGAEALVLDSDLRPAEVGEVGELYLGGIPLALGYLGSKATTAARFVPSPFGPPGARLYRTGDMVTRRDDQQILFKGRQDRQVKLRGFRVELGEIESIIESHPAVRQAAVVAPQAEGTVEALVAYVTCVDSPAEDLEFKLREHVQGLLPSYMVPSPLVLVASLPLTPSGKVDGQALETASGLRHRPAGVEMTRTESIVAEIWAQQLVVEGITPADNFLELGGHSVVANHVIRILRATFDIPLPVRTLFEEPTLRSLCAAIDESVGRARQKDVDRPTGAESIAIGLPS